MSPALRYTLRLYFDLGLKIQVEVEANVDPRANGALREHLERLVLSKTGSLNVDLSKWTLKVHSLGGGRVVATCTVDTHGRTVVTR